jgi:hypothetical protein
MQIGYGEGIRLYQLEFPIVFAYEVQFLGEIVFLDSAVYFNNAVLSIDK